MRTPHKNYKHVLFFIIGVIATIAYRGIVVLNHYDPILVETAWYVGTLGFAWYFWHRFQIENRRNKLIAQLNLLEKTQQGQILNQEDKAALVGILKSLNASLAKWNYIIIFISSFLALAYAIYFDLK